MGWSMYGRTAREYVYACPLNRNVDRWPTSLAIVTDGQLSTLTARNASRAMPVQVPDRRKYQYHNGPHYVSCPSVSLSVCSSIAFGLLTQTRSPAVARITDRTGCQ